MSKVPRLAVVQGSSRGIGRALCRFLLAKTSLDVVATTSGRADEARRRILDGGPSQELRDLGDLKEDHWPRCSSENDDGTANGRRLTCLEVDARDERTFSRAAEHVASEGIGGGKVRLLFNVSGILRVEKSLKDLRMETLIESMQINAIGHLLFVKHFAQLLPKDKSVIANLSARTGSIADNKAGGWYSYRASKAALNQMTKTLAHELSLKKSPTHVVALHPGTVATGLSADFRANLKPGQLFSPERSVDHLMQVISKLDKTGQYLDWKGEAIPW